MNSENECIPFQLMNTVFFFFYSSQHTNMAFGNSDVATSTAEAILYDYWYLKDQTRSE